MSAKQSFETKEAIRLFKIGMSPRKAAKQARVEYTTLIRALRNAPTVSREDYQELFDLLRLAENMLASFCGGIGKMYASEEEIRKIGRKVQLNIIKKRTKIYRLHPTLRYGVEKGMKGFASLEFTPKGDIKWK